ncbi:hypothetical protein F4821DRAFT_248607 [Hypoxylon rubiginosum]|uniref:Uncharacterized protein n=1 Tax=Hypoxylon rubiginosum TaxID=110542 RepID=A0ACC0CMR3_9PEZI|nr:hypothetical protein F4821DRAFT_248607 [Hypoxylon rubiginosum]
MDDQFNGRTDDDLFADDFEPVEAQEVVQPQPTQNDQPTAPAAESKPPPVSEASATATPAPSAPSAPRSSLAQSRHAHAKPAPSSHHAHPRPRKHSPKPTAAVTTTTTTTTTPGGSGAVESSSPQESPAAKGGETNSSNGSKKPQVSPAKPGQNTALADRLASGANPRQKLTESELAAKMEQMRILAAEKTRRFEQAERDSRSHAIAYEKGMEEARKRRAEEAERRRRGDDERRRMDEERAANRERKLKAMGAKEGGSWDEGKSVEEERERRAGFRSANGGVRGAKNTGGMAASRFADRDDAAPREFGVDDFRGRGRGGRGRGGGRGSGRGGRGGYNEFERGGKPAQNGSAPHQQKPAQAPPTAEDFPALPVAKKLDTGNQTTDAADSALTPDLGSPLVGKWDDEMAALDDAKP